MKVDPIGRENWSGSDSKKERNYTFNAYNMTSAKRVGRPADTGNCYKIDASIT